LLALGLGACVLPNSPAHGEDVIRWRLSFPLVALVPSVALSFGTWRAPNRGQEAAIRVTAFQLQRGASAVLPGTPMSLDHTTVGAAPDAYRVSTAADLRGAVWQRYERNPRWTPADARLVAGGNCGPRGALLVAFFQVRARALSQRGDTGYTLSNVARDSICVTLGDSARTGGERSPD